MISYKNEIIRQGGRWKRQNRSSSVKREKAISVIMIFWVFAGTGEGICPLESFVFLPFKNVALFKVLFLSNQHD
jgi:hypothetical protein